MSHLILFDDGGGKLSPLCDLRASFELRSGALTTAERLTEQFGKHPAALAVPTDMAALTASRHPEPVNQIPAGERFMVLNGRWTRLEQLLPDQMNSALIAPDGTVLAALLDRISADRFVKTGGRLEDRIKTTRVEKAEALLSRPWHLLQQANVNLDIDLVILAKRMNPLNGEPSPRVTVVGPHPVLIGKGTVIHPHVVFDTNGGPFAVDDGAEIRSMGVLVGPGYVGRGTAITNHAHIRGHCIIGPVCKVGGEVNSSIFQGYSNKAHSGYMGNSYMGEWSNFGADTVTSNLKNTYGEIRLQLTPGGTEEPTGMRNLGSIIGDHVKTAIGTRLSTGTVAHLGAMIAVSAFPPKCVKPFAFLTDQGDEKYDLGKFRQVAQTVMGRRQMELTPALRDRLAQLHSRA